jgi:hypothetical protein
MRSIDLLTFDVEVLSIAFSVPLLIGSHAGVESSILSPDLLKNQSLVPYDDSVRHVLNQKFSLKCN